MYRHEQSERAALFVDKEMIVLIVLTCELIATYEFVDTCGEFVCRMVVAVVAATIVVYLCKIKAICKK